MGQADVNVNLWLKDTKRFADLFNAILFHGETVILPENLHPSPETTAVSLQDAQGKNVVKKQYRDIIMNWQDQAVLMLLAVESQTAIHYAAPLKVMLYDSMEYAEPKLRVAGSNPVCRSKENSDSQVVGYQNSLF